MGEKAQAHGHHPHVGLTNTTPPPHSPKGEMCGWWLAMGNGNSRNAPVLALEEAMAKQKRVRRCICGQPMPHTTRPARDTLGVGEQPVLCSG